MSKNKITNLEAFEAWVSETFGRPANKLNWGFADGKYLKLFGGPPNAENFWMWREFLRMYRHNPQCAYKAPVWSGQLDPIPGHFVHVAPNDESQVAYTPDAAKGARDICVVTKPGKYLQKFYPSIGEAEIRRLANHHRDLYTTEDVAFACTADEVEDVYVRGPSSCMKKAADDFPTKIQPVRVYGESPDLVVAYLNRDSGISGRAVCDISSKPPRFSRVYGDTNLKLKLERMGFQYVGDGKPLTGAKLKVVKDDFGRIIMPYVDWCGHGTLHKKDGFIELGNSAAPRVALQNTAGYVEQMYTCPTCQSETPGNGFMYHSVFGHGNLPGCQHCGDRVLTSALCEPGGGFQVALRSDCDRYTSADGALSIIKGLTPEQFGYVKFDERTWARPDQIVTTVNNGRVLTTQTPVMNVNGLFLDLSAELGELVADDFVVGVPSDGRDWKLLFKPDRTTLRRDMGSFGEMARYATAMGLTLMDVFDAIVPSSVNTSTFRRLGRKCWSRDYAEAYDVAETFLPENYPYPRDMLERLDVRLHATLREERLADYVRAA